MLCVAYREKGSFLTRSCVCFWKYRISQSDRPPGLNCMPFPAHQLGFMVALQLELSGWRCFFHDTHCWHVQPFTSHGICCTGAGPFRHPCFFFATKFFGVVFVRAILNKYVEHKLLCWLLG